MQAVLITLFVIVLIALIAAIVLVGFVSVVLIYDDPTMQKFITSAGFQLRTFSSWMGKLKVRYTHKPRHAPQLRKVTNAELVGIRYGWAHCM